MSTLHLVPADILNLYKVQEWRNAAGVLTTARPAEWNDLLHALRGFRLMRSEVVQPGGRKSLVASRFDGLLVEKGWIEKQFDTSIKIDDTELKSPTHKVDCYKNHVALEVEWNNKTEFYDRDLNNFRMLYDLRVIDVGIIVTRCTELRPLLQGLGRGSYGASTTHFDKLIPRIEGGGGGGCPILIFGISEKLYVEDKIQAEPDLPGSAADEAGADEADDRS